MASLTKIMTAYLILRDHPLAAGQQGPPITDDAGRRGRHDHDIGHRPVQRAPVQAGEVLTERQLLEGLLVHSANDFADALARWDAGSCRAFVAKMNAGGVQLGMAQTHFVDANGYRPSPGPRRPTCCGWRPPIWRTHLRRIVTMVE